MWLCTEETTQNGFAVLKPTSWSLRKDWMTLLVATLVIFNGIDGVLTIYWVISHRAVEANPLMAWLIEVHPVIFILSKLSLVSLGLILLLRLRNQSNLASVGIVISFAIYSYVMVCQCQGLLLRLA